MSSLLVSEGLKMIHKLAVLIGTLTVSSSGMDPSFAFELFTDSELDQIEKEFQLTVDETNEDPLAGAPLRTPSPVPMARFLREKLAMIDLLKAYPHASEVAVYQHMKKAVPDTTVSLQFAITQRSNILSIVSVPDWFHTALIGLKDQILDPSVIPQMIHEQVTALAPPGSAIMKNPTLLKNAIFVWINYCLKPTWLRPNTSGEPYCIRSSVNNGVGEYTVSHRLSRTQFNLFLDAYAGSLRRRSLS
jgi:hypothetical protein